MGKLNSSTYFAGADKWFEMRWEMFQFYNQNNSTILNWPNKRKSFKCGKQLPVFSSLTKMLIASIASTTITWLFMSLLAMIPCVSGIPVTNISMPTTCGPIMGGVLLACILLAVLPTASDMENPNEDVEVVQTDLQQLPIHELASLMEEDSDEEADDSETSLVTNDLDHTVITHFKYFQFGPKRGTGRWLINILVGPYTYGTKKINAGEGKFHCQKCLSGFGK